MKNFIRQPLGWLSAALISVALVGCGGSDNGRMPIFGGSVVVGVSPTVVSVAPLARATAVPINTKKITANFSTLMDSASINAASFTLACPMGTAVGGTVSYNPTGSLATLTLPPQPNLPANVVCTATVTTGAKDSIGTPIATNFAWSFTTGSALNPDVTAPTVSSTSNANGATGVPTNNSPSVTFSEAMDPATLTTGTYTLKQGTNAVAGNVSYSGVTATFKPASLLSANTTYTATVTSGATDLAGNALTPPYTWSWTTSAIADTTPPTVTSTVQANGATGVPINARIGATFSEAMDPVTINNTSFTLATDAGVLVPGVVSYANNNASFVPNSNLAPSTHYNAKIKGATGGVTDVAGNALASDYTWSWTTAATADTTAPQVLSVFPAENATGVATNTTVRVTFDEAIDPLTVNTNTFRVAGITGTVTLDVLTRTATFKPAVLLAAGTTYIATVKGGTGGVKDVSGNDLAADKTWSFTTAPDPLMQPSVNLASASNFGTFGGTAGMTNTGILTKVNGNIGTIATGTSSITGFHDNFGDIYTETPANIGAVNTTIFTCTNSTTGPTAAGPNAASCAVATQARLDAQSAYLALAGMPPGANPGANLANLTLAPGVYTSPSGSFLIEGGNLTLDAQGNPNAMWVFQMATTLTVGGPGAAAPQSIILAGGAQAKNVFWQVGSFATINAAGGGTMVGTIISQNGGSFSTAGNVNVVTLNGRALSLGASVTLVNTVINVP